MNDSVRLTQAVPDDLAAAIEFVRTYFEHDGLTFDSDVERAVGLLLADPSLGRFWFVEAGGERSGYLVLTFAFDYEFGGRIGLVTDFFLVEEARGHGCGQAAMHLALEEARQLGLRAVELYVLDHNVRARAFYRRLGFESVQGRAPMFLRL